MLLRRSANLVGLMLSFSVSAQVNLIFSNDLHSGINAAPISPTHTFLNPNPWEISFFSSATFLQNDYVYISDLSFAALRNVEIEAASPKNGISGENASAVLDYFHKDFSTYHFSSEITGPSASFKTKIKDKAFSAGVFSRLRTHTSAVRIDNYLKYSTQYLPEPPEYTLQPLSINLMNWAEFGLNVATEIFPYSESQWVIGANLKYEAGFDALQVNSRQPMTLRRTTEDSSGVGIKTITASAYDLEVNFATNYNFSAEKYELEKRGSGYGLDFGISVNVPGTDEEGYDFRAGLHVLDLGQINFDGQQHILKGAPLRVVNNPKLENTRLENPDKIFRLLSSEVYGDEDASLQGDRFSMGLPTALHLNVSRRIGPHQYLNADWLQRVPVFENSLKRSNLFNISYLVQKRALGFGASASLYEYSRLQLGGYLRLGPLIFGSENFLPLIFRQEKLRAGSFYVALKLYPFWDTELKRHRRGDCYTD